jgi:hypothetical protein
MGPSRKEIIEHLVALIVATQDLTRATKESTREYRALREEIARLDRRSRHPRPVRLARSARVHPPGTVTDLRVRRPS